MLLPETRSWIFGHCHTHTRRGRETVEGKAADNKNGLSKRIDRCDVSTCFKRTLIRNSETAKTRTDIMLREDKKNKTPDSSQPSP